MKKLSDHLFWVEDTCSAYAVKDADGSLLIDCGTDFSPTAAAAATLPGVERILLTHFHRDQVAAAPVWRRQGARLTVPFCERRYCEEADMLRASYDTFDNYTSYYPTFGSLEDVVADDYAYDYESISWRRYSFEVVPLPGHTFGSGVALHAQ